MMRKDMSRVKVSAIVFLNSEPPYPLERFYQMVMSLFQQYGQGLELVIMDQLNDPAIHVEICKINKEKNPLHFVHGNHSTVGAWLNAAVKHCHGEYILLIDSSKTEVQLKNTATTLFLLAAQRHPGAGLIYADYEIENNGSTKEIHLLPHHRGRLRDNQDYGSVYFIAKTVWTKVKGADADLKFNTWYDLRLKISEKAELIHISNRHAGSLYKIVATEKGHNVFDYLLAGKENQLEAEQVASGHLKRIGAYLKAGSFYHHRPDTLHKSHLKASVIIPVNNRPEFIGMAIESVLNQTIKDLEVIVVVNGGQQDSTVNAVKTYMAGGIKYISGRPEVRLIVLDINNIGLSLNCGIQAAQGEIYVQLDSDDRLKPQAVEKILEVFESDPAIGIVIGSYEVWQLNDATAACERVESIPVVTHDEWTEKNGRNNLLRINGAGAPRSIPIDIIKKLGYFSVNDELYARNYGEDYDMVLKISEQYKVGRIWEPVYDVVRHKGGTDHSIDQQTIDRNDEAKDHMRDQAIERRIKLNKRRI
jgi:glycosyltransferase involved in cell wall biosynthesis